MTAVLLCVFTALCFHGKCPRRISSSYKNPQASFNLRVIMFSTNLSNIRVTWNSSCEAQCLYLWKTSRWQSLLPPLWIILGVWTDFFSPHSVWGEEWDKLRGMFGQCDGESWEKTFLFLLGCFKKRSVLGGGTVASDSSSTSTPVRLVWGVTDLYIQTPPPLCSTFVCVCVYICPEYLGSQCSFE